MARTELDKPGADAISTFLVPRDTPGPTIGKKDHKMGQHGTTTSDLIFENVRVPASAIIGLTPGRGFRLAMRVLDRGRIHIAALATGACKRLIAEMVNSCARAQTVRQTDRRIPAHSGDDRGQPDRISRRPSARRADDRNGAARTEASAAKYFATEAVGRVVDRAV